MSRRNTISVFEHQALRIGRQYGALTFEQRHWEALVRYNDAHGSQYFNVGHRSIKFKQYVGVLQVGNLTIEILPKADRRHLDDEDSQQKWRGVLLDMLHISKHLRLDVGGKADQTLRRRSLLDIFIEHFLSEVERLLHQGLTRQYRVTAGNRMSLSGSLVFPKHLQQNLVHKERFYVRHQVYDRQHLLHQIIQEALRVLGQSFPSPLFRDRLARLQLDFPEQPRLKVTPATFERIRYDRKTEAYREAIELARLILLQYSPDLQAGRQHVLAILFDMNALFEDYVYQVLRKELGAIVQRQRSKKFWGNQRIRPDIVIEHLDGTIVLDTKWKILTHLRPDDGDLRQLYTYQQYWEAQKGYLVYPATGLQSTEDVFHLPADRFWGGVLFWEVVRGGKLNMGVPEDLKLDYYKGF